jgi:hypothetical protein
LKSLETAFNEKDLDTVLLFAEDATLHDSWNPYMTVNDSWLEIDFLWTNYIKSAHTTEFRNISIDGDTATFDWVAIGAIHTEITPIKVEVQNGKITFKDWFAEPEEVRTGEE